jgi:hypothetical protein
MNFKTIACFDRREDAEFLVSRLKASHLHAKVYDESALQRFGFMVEPGAAEKVEVPDNEMGLAAGVLQGLDGADDILQRAIHCPECGSLKVEYPQYTRKFFTPMIIELLMRLGVVEKHYYCCSCQWTWPRHPRKPEPSRDVFGWPERR